MAHHVGINFAEFREQFQTETACQAYLFAQKWPEGFVCPHCGGRDYYAVKKGRGIYQCKHCRHQSSLTANTVMHHTHLPLTTWFWAIYLLGNDKRGISAVNLAEKLSVCYETAWYLLRRIRMAMGKRDENYKLAGIVEFDDAYFGATEENGKRGRGTEKTNVLIALSKSEDGKPRFLKMQVADDLKGTTIGAFAEKNIEVGTTIQSDAYASYRKPLAENYDHQYKVSESDPDTLKWLHIMVSNAKAFVVGTFHGLGEPLLQTYLDEFCYRFNRRFFHHELFPRLVTAVAQPYM